MAKFSKYRCQVFITLSLESAQRARVLYEVARLKAVGRRSMSETAWIQQAIQERLDREGVPNLMGNWPIVPEGSTGSGLGPRPAGPPI